MGTRRLLHEANEVLRDLNRKRTRISGQLGSMPSYEGWVLRMESKSGSKHRYYDVIRKGSKKKSYLGGDNHEQVLNVKRYRYAKKALSVLDRDIELLDMLLREYVDPNYTTINSMLPKTYQTDFRASDISDTGMPQEAVGWKKRLEEEKAKYPPYKPEQLKHPTLDGKMLRSKSEVIIYNILLQAGIPFVYEAPIFIDGEMVLPDFRILSLIDLSTEIIIEHQGMVFLDGYANKFIKSLRLYLHSDWIPNVNLFFTYDNARETLDPSQVTSILRKHIDPSL